MKEFIPAREVITCDRCGAKTEVVLMGRKSKELDGWFNLKTETLSAPVVYQSTDLCPACRQGLEEFMQSAKDKPKPAPKPDPEQANPEFEQFKVMLAPGRWESLMISHEWTGEFRHPAVGECYCGVDGSAWDCYSNSFVFSGEDRPCRRPILRRRLVETGKGTVRPNG